MTDQAQSLPTLPAPPLQASFRRLARNLVVDAVLPWLAVQLLERLWGVGIVPALAMAAIFPVASVVLSWTRHRRPEVIGIGMLAAILSGVGVALVTDDAHFAVLKAAPAFGLFGLACLASLGRKRPLMFFVARQFIAGGDAAKAAAWTARLEDAGFRRSMRLLTIVWGVAALCEAALGIAAAFLLAPHIALVAEPVLGIGTTAALIVWTTAYSRGRQEA
jgi:hypothetical protein